MVRYKGFQHLNLPGNQIAIVRAIGCSGLFDTLFDTHAFHGLHGRALTYAAGIKLARPELNVVVTMGDGGMGIGGAHLLSACRRNLDMTLIVLNNFNFGMTGGQFSVTTPPDALVGSGFLNQLERPLDICQVALSAGAPYVTRCSGYQKNLSDEIRQAIEFDGFAVIDTGGYSGVTVFQENREIGVTDKKKRPRGRLRKQMLSRRALDAVDGWLGRTAAAAGGCMLVKREALEAAGGQARGSSNDLVGALPAFFGRSCPMGTPPL